MLQNLINCSCVDGFPYINNLYNNITGSLSSKFTESIYEKQYCSICSKFWRNGFYLFSMSYCHINLNYLINLLIFSKTHVPKKTVPHQIITRITKFYNFHFIYSQCSTHLTNYNNKWIKTVWVCTEQYR